MVTNFNTVAITTCTINENESWSFVKCLLCEEVQVSQMLENPININAFEQFAEEAIVAANEVRLAQDESARILDYSDIIRYEEMLLKADSSSFADTQILSIMNEELQAFYHGDKSIDEVIAIIEDRCQTVLDERK